MDSLPGGVELCGGVDSKSISSGDGSDGGKTCILTLILRPSDPAAEPEVATTNKEKSAMLMRLMFPIKPRGYSVPVESYDDQLPSLPEITESQVRRHIVKLRPHKAPGANSIPNIVIKMSADVIMPHLLQIFCATIRLGIYAEQWKEVETYVLWKPGKPRYDIPKAYRPVALVNTIAKLLSSIVAEDLVYLTEKHALLPATTLGGGLVVLQRTHYTCWLTQ